MTDEFEYVENERLMRSTSDDHDGETLRHKIVRCGGNPVDSQQESFVGWFSVVGCDHGKITIDLGSSVRLSFDADGLNVKPGDRVRLFVST
jgi:hypothetical protein